MVGFFSQGEKMSQKIYGLKLIIVQFYGAIVWLGCGKRIDILIAKRSAKPSVDSQLLGIQ